MVLYHYHNTFSYEPLRKLIKKRRMTISSFGKRVKLSKTDLYRMQIDQLSVSSANTRSASSSIVMSVISARTSTLKSRRSKWLI